MINKSIVLALVINFIFFGGLQANVNNKIIVKVGSEIVTKLELKNKILTNIFLSGRELNQENIDSLKKVMLDQLINLKLKKIELKKFKIKKDKNRINSYLNSISKNNVEEFKIKFKENNLSFDLFVDEIDTEFRWQKLIYSIYSNKIVIKDETINKEIEEIFLNNKTIQEFELSEIVIDINLNEPTDKKIEKILNEIKLIGFEETALNYSSSSTSLKKGYLGWINEKSLSGEIYQSIKNLNLGEVTQPITQQNTILFLKLLNTRTVGGNDLDRDIIKKNIIEKKKSDLFNLYSQSKISILKNNTLIEYL